MHKILLRKRIKVNTISYLKEVNTFTYDLRMSNMRENLRREMDLKNWNAYDLAESSGVPQSIINRFLNGVHKSLNEKNVAKLASGLGISEASLRGLEGGEPQARIFVSYRSDPKEFDINLERFKALLGDYGKTPEQRHVTFAEFAAFISRYMTDEELKKWTDWAMDKAERHKKGAELFKNT